MSQEGAGVPKQEEFKNPNKRQSPLEYYRTLQGINRTLQAELSTRLQTEASELGTLVTLVTPGSDGRLEKGSTASPLELIALVDANVDPETFEETLSSVLKKTTNTRLYSAVETKGPASSMAMYRDDSHRIQPGRIADSRRVYGSEAMHESAKRRLGEEILNLPRKAIVKPVEQLMQRSRSVTREGKNRIRQTDAIHFDLETGVVYFNPDAFQCSFKIGPLRLVQNMLLSEEVKHTRRAQDPEFIGRMPGSVVDRLELLSDDKMLNITRASMEELAEHYAYFLQLYHRSEQAYTARKEVALQMSPSETEEVARRLQSLVELSEKFSIRKQS